MESKKIKKGDFIEVDYTGTIKEDNAVFDTTSKAVAEKNGLSKEATYRPLIICVGEGFILPALEEGLVGKELGKEHFELVPEMAFGKKSAQLLKLIPLKVFKEQDIMPYAGLEVNIDGSYGTVRNVSGGRIIVDFNHPLSSHDLIYDIEVKRFVTGDKEKLESLLKASGVHFDSASVKEKDAMIVLEHELPDHMKSAFEEKAKELIKLKKFSYIVKKTKK